VSLGRDEFALQLSDGKVVECDMVAVGVGMQPNVELAVRSGIDCRAGIVVNEFTETNAPNVFAAGDVAEHYHPLFDAFLRLEHHDNALKQGAIVGATITGSRIEHRDPPWFWSDQYDYNLQVVGMPHIGDTVVMRGRVSDRRFTAFHLRDGVLVGAVGINSGNDVKRTRRLIADRVVAPASLLSDSGIDLRRLSA
jgi:3-phenylpropionate/trans-cinnamate dioxygenase ferredoxin reductase subunit